MMKTLLHKISQEKANGKIKSQQMQRKSFDKFMKLMKETLLINRIKLPSLLGKSLGDVFLSSRIHKNINKQTCIVCRKRRK